MKSKSTILFPTATKMLAQLGEVIKLARLRRKLTTEQVAERSSISHSTLWLDSEFIFIPLLYIQQPFHLMYMLSSNL